MHIIHKQTDNGEFISDNKIEGIIDLFRSFHKKSIHNNQFEDIGKNLFSQQIKHFNDNQPLQFLLPGFPCKSPNTQDKVLGHLPDKGEQIGIDRLESFCENISKIHSPGAIMTIASDGKVFNDIIGVPDEHVDAYKNELISMVSKKSLIKILGLEDLLGGNTNDIRKTFDSNFCHSQEIIQQKIIENDDIKKLFLGLKKFLTEDIPSDQTISNSQREKLIKHRAKEALRRSLGFDTLLSQVLPNHIRLSVHPHSTENGKFGFNLIGNNDNRGTPRHNVVVETANQILLMKKREAEQLGCTLQLNNGRKWGFENNTI